MLTFLKLPHGQGTIDPKPPPRAIELTIHRGHLRSLTIKSLNSANDCMVKPTPFCNSLLFFYLLSSAMSLSYWRHLEWFRNGPTVSAESPSWSPCETLRKNGPVTVMFGKATYFIINFPPEIPKNKAYLAVYQQFPWKIYIYYDIYLDKLYHIHVYIYIYTHDSHFDESTHFWDKRMSQIVSHCADLVQVPGPHSRVLRAQLLKGHPNSKSIGHWKKT